MVIVAIMAAGAAAVFLGWRVVAAGEASVWLVMTSILVAAGVGAVATGRVGLSPRLRWPWALPAGAVAGALLYVATAAFVLVVRRWPVFDRHVAEIYDQRRGLPLGMAFVLAALLTAPGEELFWRGLFQGRLAASWGWPAASMATWGAYIGANSASGSLPILAGAVVSGAVWGALALWTHGVLASLTCHSVWTGLMILRPPGGPAERGKDDAVHPGTSPPGEGPG